MLNGTDAEVTIRAFDAAGNQGEATTRVRVDTEAPQVTLTPPLESFVSGVVTITASDVPDDLAQIAMQDHATSRMITTSTSNSPTRSATSPSSTASTPSTTPGRSSPG